MKNILLVFFLVQSFFSYAQWNITQSFDTQPPFDGVISFGSNGAVSTLSACSGTGSWAQNFSPELGRGGVAISFKDLAVPQFSNGQEVKVSINFRKSTGLSGDLHLALFRYSPQDGNWVVSSFAQSFFDDNQVAFCDYFEGKIPVGVALENALASGEKYAVGAFFSRTSGSGTVFFDDLKILQENASSVPDCVIATVPANGTTVSFGQVKIEWSKVAKASEYQVTVGTSSGAADVFNEKIAGKLSSVFVNTVPSKTYFVKIVPINHLGAAIGCAETSFQTSAAASYCGPLVYGGIEAISNVTFAGINNSSAVNTSVSHEFFTEQKALVQRGQSYSIQLNGDTGGNYTSFYIVFIDWNQNGVLNDPGEVYFDDGSLFQINANGTTSTPAIGTIAVPENAKFGDTRIRVKKEYSGGVPPVGSKFYNPCETGEDFGQAEDYTINVRENSLSVGANAKDAIVLYPNPFKEVLKISDVKEVVSVAVLDLSGKLLKKFNATAELQLSFLQSGLYIVNLNLKDGSVKSFKVIKE